MSTRVLLIDDHALFRRGVAQVIESDPELQFVGEACDGARGIELASEVAIAAVLTRTTAPNPIQEEADLTERENQILGSLALGHSNKEIARQLGISDATVKVHIKNLLRKLNLKSRLEAAVWALNRGNARSRGDSLQ